MQGEGSYLNIHHTVKIAVVPNIKATLRFLNILFQLDVRFNIFIRLDVRFSYHLWLDIWFRFYDFYLFKLDIEIDL